MNNNDLIDILRNIETKLNIINLRLDNLNLRLTNIEIIYNRLDNHITFIEDVYYKMKLPLDYFINKINYIIYNNYENNNYIDYYEVD
jgi:hypothetical protein